MTTPSTGVSSTDLYLPVGRQILFKLTSTDVIHSFWVPEFRIKQDAVPGTWTELRVTPTEMGDYRDPLRRDVRLRPLGHVRARRRRRARRL